MTVESSRLRRAIPRPLKKIILAPLVYWRRLVVWQQIARQICFVSGPHGNTLLRSRFLAPFTSLRSLGEWRDPLLLGDAVVKVANTGMFHVRGHSDDLFHILPSQEPAVDRAVRDRLRPGDVFVDAGSNIGFYAILAAGIVGSAGHVLAIEMMPDTFAQLTQNVRLNGYGNVHCVNRALADFPDRQVQAFMAKPGLFGQASIVSSGEDAPKLQVQTETLDRLLANHAEVRLIKMDLEGAEHLALEGARDALNRVQAIIFEAWHEDSPARLFLQQHGFVIRPLDNRNLIAERPE